MNYLRNQDPRISDNPELKQLMLFDLYTDARDLTYQEPFTL